MYSFEIVIKQVNFEGGFERGRRTEWHSVSGKMFQTGGPA